MAAHRQFLAKLPRGFYWIIGGGVACGGAFIARLLAEQVADDYRIAVWLAGGAVIFLGVAVLSMGTRANLERDDG